VTDSEFGTFTNARHGQGELAVPKTSEFGSGVEAVCDELAAKIQDRRRGRHGPAAADDGKSDTNKIGAQ
jgi:hypothetical protein